MAMNLGSPEDDEDGAMNATINTTPLVDVMLVLLIIFLITIPVVTQSVQLSLPKESNAPTQTRPENILLAVTHDGQMYWNTRRIPDIPTLVAELKKEAVKVPQPEVHIRGDENARYEAVGQVVTACQRAGIAKVGFITEPAGR
ncbi:biopolymer transporter ExbD [Vitreoscilla filiformis]|jgi:biopolymer transport protein ExbD|uniref:Biopolymer transporter ExbD n=1 Tax=Vitreoscilla filiformis TaxID=63 RepID=A0A221KB36_VITFI|nr:biopolymer transporter ExbD [Vitreoscilla filiformis]ASM76189.1 biopolymer transporter ExbD [Vitreoscilla filiformis]